MWIRGFWIGQYICRENDSRFIYGTPRVQDFKKDNPFTILQTLKMKAVYSFETLGNNSLATWDRPVGRLIQNLINPDNTFIKIRQTV